LGADHNNEQLSTDLRCIGISWRIIESSKQEDTQTLTMRHKFNKI